MSPASIIKAVAAVAAIALVWWIVSTVDGWRSDALTKAKAVQERDAAIERERVAGIKQRAAERAQSKASAELIAERAKDHEKIVPIIKRVPVYVDRGSCTLSVDGVRALNDARGAVDMPATDTRALGDNWTTGPIAGPGADAARPGRDLISR